MSLSPPPTYDVHSTPSYMTTTSLKPYLELPHLLSLTWLAYPILSLVFVAFRLQISSSQAQDAIDSAKANLVTSCKAAERAATAAASMPRYMAVATNEQFADAVNGSLNAARATLVLALTIMEVIINFIIDLYRSTFLCFLELVIRGGLSILISAVQELNTVVQSAASGIKSSIQSDIGSANSAIQSAIDGINKVNPFGKITAPQIAVPSLDGLDNITFPTTFQDALTKLNDTLPTFAQLKQDLENVIDKPFELLKVEINETFGNITFDGSVLPVPQQNTLSFCNDMDTGVVDDLGRDLVKVAKIGVVVLILLALLLIGLNCLLEWYKWWCMKRHLEYTRQAWATDPTIVQVTPAKGGAPSVTMSDHNLLMLQANSSHPLITRIVNKISQRLRLSPPKHINLQWFLHYIFHPPALACLLIGLFGLLSVQIQLVAIHALQAKYDSQATAEVSNFSNTIAASINASMYNQSSEYANDVNGRVDAIQSTINDGLFGWVNVTTTTLNNTISTFYEDIQNAVSSVFSGTILDQPTQEFLKCFIGTKVDAIESALTFLHDNLKIDMPRVNQTVLVLSPESVNEATQPIAAAAIGDGSGNNEGVLTRVIKAYEASLRKERLMFGIFMALWGFVVLMGLCVIWWHSYGKGMLEARKRKKWEREQRSGVNGLVVPFRVGVPRTTEKRDFLDGKRHEDIPDFTPMPSPKATFNPFSTLARSVSPATSKGKAKDESTPALDSLKAKSGKSWDNLFGDKPRTLVISKPFGRKSVAKEKFVPDEESSYQGSSKSGHSDNRNTAWYGRVAATMGKKQPETESAGLAGRGRPNLQISVDPTMSNPHFDHVPRGAGQTELQSRWSASPDAKRITMPWMSPRRASSTDSPSRPEPRKNSTIPSDVNSVYEDSTLPQPMQPTPFAPPLHLSFESPHKQRIRASAIYYTPPTPLGPSSPAPPPLPPRDHRRTLSIPAWTIPNSDISDASITPVTQFLMTTHARKSSLINPNENPFVTPFDDEHRVKIDKGTPRKSIPTNPFTNGVAF